jgi:hypothetical protein
MPTARDHVAAAERAEFGFLVHAAVYLGVNAGLATLNVVRNPQNPWFLWPLVCWGVGLACHAIATHHSPQRERLIDRIELRIARRRSKTHARR